MVHQPMILRILSDRKAAIILGILLVGAFLVPVLNLAVPESSFFHVPSYLVTLMGKYLTLMPLFLI